MALRAGAQQGGLAQEVGGRACTTPSSPLELAKMSGVSPSTSAPTISAPASIRRRAMEARPSLQARVRAVFPFSVTTPTSAPLPNSACTTSSSPFELAKGAECRPRKCGH